MTLHELRGLGAEVAGAYTGVPLDGWDEITLEDSREWLRQADAQLRCATNKAEYESAQSLTIDLRSALGKAGTGGRIFKADQGRFFAGAKSQF
jgi:hypothetical protein